MATGGVLYAFRLSEARESMVEGQDEARRKCASVHATSSRQASPLAYYFNFTAVTFILSNTILPCAYLGSHRHKDYGNVSGISIILCVYRGLDIDGMYRCWAIFTVASAFSLQGVSPEIITLSFKIDGLQWNLN